MSVSRRHEGSLLSAARMVEVDQAAIHGGTPGSVLMERAGLAVADAVIGHFTPQPILVLAGPGNNGGDGFVAARHLARRGWPVSVALLGVSEQLRGDAALAASAWQGPLIPATAASVGGGIVIDGLFGTGLRRPLIGEALDVVRALGDGVGRRPPIVSIDIPSGISADTGKILGAAVKADLTVTFFRKKLGHVLLPGREHCGRIEVSDIGISYELLDDCPPLIFENAPERWVSALPRPSIIGHKYVRGHVLVVGGRRMAGAARLAAHAASRAGAGLVSLAVPLASTPLYAGMAESVIIRPFVGPEGLERLLCDPRLAPVLVGPGAGSGPQTRLIVETIAGFGRSMVLDADALTAFSGEADILARLIDGGEVVITPHDGEICRLLSGLAGPGPNEDRLTRCLFAARRLGAVVLLKGPDTVVASPDGRAMISAGAPPTLATAGSGDVLSGVVAGLMAQGMSAFHAASAGVWLHGKAAELGPSGLVAGDLPRLVGLALGACAQHSRQAVPM